MQLKDTPYNRSTMFNARRLNRPKAAIAGISLSIALSGCAPMNESTCHPSCIYPECYKAECSNREPYSPDEFETCHTYLFVFNWCSFDDPRKLITAARSGALDTVMTEIANGESVNATSNNGATALMGASRGKHKDIVEFLIDHKAKVNKKDDDGWTALIYAVAAEDNDIAGMLLAHGADPNIRNKDGKTALTIATDNQDTEMAGILRAHGAK